MTSEDDAGLAEGKICFATYPIPLMRDCQLPDSEKIDFLQSVLVNPAGRQYTIIAKHTLQ